MSTPIATSAERVARNQRRGLIVGLLVLVVLGIFGIAHWWQKQHGLPDEKAAAAELLAQKFTGPRYFLVLPGTGLDEAGVLADAPSTPHISLSAATAQVERISQERHLGPNTTAKLNQLIDRLTEEPKSRLVGRQHLNLLRLNLALDELK